MIAIFVEIKLPLPNINNISQWIFTFAMTCKNNFGVNNSATFVTKKKIIVIETQFLLICNFVFVQDILSLLYIITKMNYLNWTENKVLFTDKNSLVLWLVNIIITLEKKYQYERPHSLVYTKQNSHLTRPPCLHTCN
jgi:hypothetical protein